MTLKTKPKNRPAGFFSDIDSVLGIGTDLLYEKRIEPVYVAHGERFLNRILRPSEKNRFAQSSWPINFLAKAFCAKEAASKALGTGLSQGVSFLDFELDHSLSGQPIIDTFNHARGHLLSLGGKKILLSLTDDQHWVQAFAVAI